MRACNDAEGTEVVTFIYSLTRCFLSASLWAPLSALPTQIALLQGLLGHLPPVSQNQHLLSPGISALTPLEPTHTSCNT